MSNNAQAVPPDSLNITPSIAAQHPRLYHYTNAHSFRSIVTGNTFWGTYFEDLNNATEFRHMHGPLGEELGKRCVPIVEAFSKRGTWEADIVRRHGGVSSSSRKVGKSLVTSLYKATFGKPFHENLSPCFVTSFCTHKPDGYVEDNGLLSQWRGYGNSIDGSFCLVFDTRRFEALIEEERQAYQFAYIGLGIAHYYKDRKSMPPYFEELVTQAEAVLADVLAGGDFPMAGMSVPFARGATSTKHQSFAEESEVRLLSMPISQRADEAMKLLPGYKSSLLKTSFPCTIGTTKKRHIRLFTDRSKLPLLRVIVGPARDQKRNVEIACETVGRGVDVIRSETPLIG
jgi:hypothetical protein